MKVENNLNVNIPACCIGQPKAGNFKASTGWPAFVAGGGIEHKISDRWSIKGKIISYVISGINANPSDTYYFPATGCPVKYTNQLTTTMIGLNYHF